LLVVTDDCTNGGYSSLIDAFIRTTSVVLVRSGERFRSVVAVLATIADSAN
jgi:hypothetical protein